MVCVISLTSFLTGLACSRTRIYRTHFFVRMVKFRCSNLTCIGFRIYRVKILIPTDSICQRITVVLCSRRIERLCIWAPNIWCVLRVSAMFSKVVTVFQLVRSWNTIWNSKSESTFLISSYVRIWTKYGVKNAEWTSVGQTAKRCWIAENITTYELWARTSGNTVNSVQLGSLYFE